MQAALKPVIAPDMDKNRIKEHRKRRNLTQYELADMTGIGQPTIAMLEAGRQDLKAFHLPIFAKALNVRPIDILPMDMLDEDTRITEFMDIEARPWASAPRDAESPANYPDAVEMLLRGDPKRSAWVNTSDALEHSGYRKGDIFILDEDAAPEPGDVVCAQVYNTSDAETVFRIFQPPFLIAATDNPKHRAPLMIDTFRVRVVGAVTETLRLRAS